MRHVRGVEIAGDLVRRHRRACHKHGVTLVIGEGETTLRSATKIPSRFTVFLVTNNNFSDNVTAGIVRAIVERPSAQLLFINHCDAAVMKAGGFVNDGAKDAKCMWGSATLNFTVWRRERAG